MKRLLLILGALAALLLLAVLVVGGLVLSNALRPARPVAMEQVVAADPGAARGKVGALVFYPTTAKPRLTLLGMTAVELAPGGPVAPGRHPMVVISHGSPASPVSHLDTALALAEAGYVVVALQHNGDNVQDQSSVGTPGWIAGRAREVARVNDHMLARWPRRAGIDPARIGLFGFSAGGTTGLVVLGGTPDLAKVGPHCAARPEFVCRLMKPGAPQGPAPTWTHDPRVRAAVIAAPGLGFTFPPDGLKDVRAPVQLWAGQADDTVPVATNAAVVRGLLPAATTESKLVSDAAHAGFLTPCGPAAALMPPALCKDPKGFDRKAFHRLFNAEVVGFFDRTLR
jgi:predicted dienelactone hydrolase